MKPWERARIAAFGKEARALLGPAYAKLSQRHKRQLRALARIESKESVRAIRLAGQDAGVVITNTATLTPAQLNAVVSFPIEGLRHGEWWTLQGQTMSRFVKSEIQKGVLLGESVSDLTNRITGPRGATRIGRRAAERIVRTSVTAISAEAQLQTMRANDDIVSEYEYVATLDDRTSPICAALDGQRFPLNDASAPRPPMHQNCRSTVRPIPNWDALGVSKTEQRMLERRKRASMNGQVSYRTYGSWLKAQSAAVQNRALGPSRAQLFRDGKVTLQDLVRKDGSSLTLKQLSRKVA